MSLENLQLEFAELIFFNDAETSSIFSPESIAIYKNNIFSTLTRGLKKTYSLIMKLLGEAYFEQLAKEYIRSYPSLSPNLNDYGEYFFVFLTNHFSSQQLSYLAEVATFEWTCHLVLLAADHPSFKVEKLKKIPIEKYDEIHFILHPTCHIKTFEYPLLKIIDLAENLSLDSTHNLTLQRETTRLLIYRKSNTISLIPLSISELIFLQKLEEGCNLKEALTATFLADKNFNLEKMLREWINKEVIVDCL